ncbi:MAG: putative nucleic acid-binding Zn-ribbon protein [bacterium]|jgi:predicted  nucleic acid-binding Zn-ribbon protein
MDVVEALSQLGEVDRKIAVNRKKLKELPKELEVEAKKLQKLQKSFDEVKGQSDKLIRRIRERERLIDTENAKTKDANDRLMQISNERAYTAIKRELDGIKKVITKTEDQVLAFEEEKEILASELKTLEQDLDETKKVFQEKKDKVEKEVEEINGSIEKTEADKKKYLGFLDKDLASAYEKLNKKNINPRVVQSKGAYCLGCGMTIPDQTYNSILKYHVGSCTHCYRIQVYTPPEEVEEEVKEVKKPKKAKKKSVKK